MNSEGDENLLHHSLFFGAGILPGASDSFSGIRENVVRSEDES